MSLNQFFQKQVLRGLSPWQEGQLTVILPDDSRTHFGNPDRGTSDILHIHHPRTFQLVALGLERGFGEAFMTVIGRAPTWFRSFAATSATRLSEAKEPHATPKASRNACLPMVASQ